jgi:hypothetical protein
LAGRRPRDSGVPGGDGGGFALGRGVAAGGLPLPIGTRDVLVTYTATISATGKWNVAFEMWLTRDPAPAEQNITDEVMIWVARNDLMPGPLVYDKVTFDGVAYTVHVAPGHGDASGGSAATWKYIAFVTREPQLSGTLNMSHFLDYLVEKQVIEPDRYIASLELGTEIESGKGNSFCPLTKSPHPPQTAPRRRKARPQTPAGSQTSWPPAHLLRSHVWQAHVWRLRPEAMIPPNPILW